MGNQCCARGQDLRPAIVPNDRASDIFGRLGPIVNSTEVDKMRKRYPLRRLPAWGEPNFQRQSITLNEIPEHANLRQLIEKHGEDFSLDYIDFLPVAHEHNQRLSTDLSASANGHNSLQVQSFVPVEFALGEIWPGFESKQNEPP